MYAATQSLRIVAAPVENGVGIYYTLPSLELNLQPTVYGRPVVGNELLILPRGVRPGMTSWDNPQHVIIIQGDVPLEITRRLRREQFCFRCHHTVLFCCYFALQN